MALYPYTPQEITLDVSDRIFNDTVIKQKATFKRLEHVQDSSYSCVHIDVLVSLYANHNGDYGTPLAGSGFSPYLKRLSADNDTLVEVQTGEILLVRTTENDSMWRATAELHEKVVMFQADFFVMLRDNQPVEIGEIIKNHIRNANQIGRFQ